MTIRDTVEPTVLPTVRPSVSPIYQLINGLHTTPSLNNTIARQGSGYRVTATSASDGFVNTGIQLQTGVDYWIEVLVTNKNGSFGLNMLEQTVGSIAVALPSNPYYVTKRTGSGGRLQIQDTGSSIGDSYELQYINVYIV